MILKRITTAKGEGRKQLVNLDNVLAIVFMIIVLTYALCIDYYVFAYFTMGLIVGRVGEIIFEVKHNLFDKPFLHCLVLLGIPVQMVWNHFMHT